MNGERGEKMSLGQKLLELRRKKGLSQEEVADKLNVSRQTISKWETDASTPDFDKILPLCSLYEISSNELLTGERDEQEIGEIVNDETYFKKKAIGIGVGVFLYFVAAAWIMVSIPVMRINPIVATAIFLIITGFATMVIVIVNMIYKKKIIEEKKEENQICKTVIEIVSILFTILYLGISFITMAWHITWLIWIVYALVEEIIKLCFLLGGKKNEK